MKLVPKFKAAFSFHAQNLPVILTFICKMCNMITGVFWENHESTVGYCFQITKLKCIFLIHCLNTEAQTQLCCSRKYPYSGPPLQKGFEIQGVWGGTIKGQRFKGSVQLNLDFLRDGWVCEKIPSVGGGMDSFSL